MRKHITKYHVIKSNERSKGIPIEKVVTDLKELRKDLIAQHDCDNIDFEYTEYPKQ